MESTHKQLLSQIAARLAPLYGDQEAVSMARILLEDLLNIRLQPIVLSKALDVSAAKQAALDDALARLQSYEPIQHITGFAHFYNSTFCVNRHTLIPRPETEELVATIVESHRHNPSLKILDIGTGSGCIPISLARYLNGAIVFATDISTDALAVARQNAARNQVEVTFEINDILMDPIPGAEYNIIVSNPPYIRLQEAAQMHANVLQYEPHQALFVPDADPLLFYRAISQKAYQALKPSGHLYLEINEFLGKETLDLVQSAGYSHCMLTKDLQGKDRFIMAVK